MKQLQAVSNLAAAPPRGDFLWGQGAVSAVSSSGAGLAVPQDGFIPSSPPAPGMPPVTGTSTPGFDFAGIITHLFGLLQSMLAAITAMLGRGGVGTGSAAGTALAGGSGSSLVESGFTPANSGSSSFTGKPFAFESQLNPPASASGSALSPAIPIKTGTPAIPLLPPDAGEENFRKAIEKQSGLSFDQFRQQFVNARNDWAVQSPEEISRVSAESIYKQLVVEQTFGPITMNAQEAAFGGGGARYKVVGAYNPQGANHNRANARVWTWQAYQDLYDYTNNPISPGGMGAIAVAGMAQSPNGVGAFAGAFAGYSPPVYDQELLSSAGRNAEKAREVMSPIILDLDGNGRPDVAAGEWKPHGDNYFSGAQQVNFDLDGDGRAELTEWMGPNDGLLAMDANHNGQIDDGKELFGTAGGFSDGYRKLAGLDQDGDGRLTGWELKDLSVWQDLDGDGTTDAGELRSAKKMGITSINTRHDGQWQSTFIRDGQIQSSWDWWPTVERG